MLYMVKRITEIQYGTEELCQKLRIPEGLGEARIGSYVWDKEGYTPQSGAFVGWNEQGLHVWMYSLEKNVRAEHTCFGDRVCEDSCLECFLNPDSEKTDRYFNYECSPKPCVFLSVGTDRFDRITAVRMPEGMEPVSVVIPGFGWSVHYTVTAAYLQSEFGVTLSSGLKMKGNFYKCGDKTETAHFGSWSPIDPCRYPEPDFHRPEYFDDIVLE